MRLLRDGGLVCYPTDTVYGIGAAAGVDAAVRRVFAVKGRSPGKALPLLLADAADAAIVAEVTPLARTLATRFWPGALTIVMRKAASYRSLARAEGAPGARWGAGGGGGVPPAGAPPARRGGGCPGPRGAGDGDEREPGGGASAGVRCGSGVPDGGYGRPGHRRRAEPFEAGVDSD